MGGWISSVFCTIDEYIRAWRENPSITFAGDLISAAIMANQQNNPIVQDAAKFIIERRDDVTDSLYRTSLSIVPAIETISEPDSISVSERLENILNQNTINKERISFLRKLIHRYPYNPIWYSEIALAYTKLGLTKKAVDYMKIAIHLAPVSRYISRSAARLFLHIGDIERLIVALFCPQTVCRRTDVTVVVASVFVWIF